MKVRVQLFAAYRDRAGQKELTLELPDGATVREFREVACQRIPGLPDPDRLVVAVNAEYADPSQPLREMDEVALIPPVSGGAT